ncbi:YjfB family protein [Bordetella genomosp. 13]|uniref:YjfB family protein n=1 Tax=Bordetella genomosp. 13 TaxID=463040 RepID=UPI0011AB2936|nr:YjfB family protein [Bordetella genomosp. 13]
MDIDVNNLVYTTLAMRNSQAQDEVQAVLLKKVLNSQADTINTLMQSVVAPKAVDAALGGSIDTQA